MVLKEYKLGNKLFEDGICDLYQATDRRNDRPVLIKLLKDELARQGEVVRVFHRCAKSYCALQGVECLRALDQGLDSGKHFVVLEYSAGQPLSHLFESTRAFSVDDAIQTIRHIAAQLRYAHVAGVAHSTLSPHNIFVERNTGAVKIADFRFDAFIRLLIERKESHVLYSLPYYSPEFVQKLTDNDSQSDIYSLGVIFYQLLVGNLPCAGQEFQALLNGHNKNSVIPPSLQRLEIPDVLDEVVAQSLQPNKESRFVNLSHFLEKLAQADRASRQNGNHVAGSPKQKLKSNFTNQLQDLENLPKTNPYKRARPRSLTMALASLMLGLVLIFLAFKFDLFTNGLHTKTSIRPGQSSLAADSISGQEVDIVDDIQEIVQGSEELIDHAIAGFEADRTLPKTGTRVVSDKGNVGRNPAVKEPAAPEVPSLRTQKPLAKKRKQPISAKANVGAQFESSIKSQLKKSTLNGLNELDGLIVRSEVKLEILVENARHPEPASIFVNGKLYGKTDENGLLVLNNLKVGRSYLIRIEEPGFEMWAKETTFAKAGFQSFKVTLTPLPNAPLILDGTQASRQDLGAVTILLSNPQAIENALVFINGKALQAGKNTAPLRVELQEGHYEISVQKQGYQPEPFTRKIDLAKGEDRTIYFYLIPEE